MLARSHLFVLLGVAVKDSAPSFSDRRAVSDVPTIHALSISATSMVSICGGADVLVQSSMMTTTIRALIARQAELPSSQQLVDGIRRTQISSHHVNCLSLEQRPAHFASTMMVPAIYVSTVHDMTIAMRTFRTFRTFQSLMKYWLSTA
jgi:hypothetical protein